MGAPRPLRPRAESLRRLSLAVLVVAVASAFGWVVSASDGGGGWRPTGWKLAPPFRYGAARVIDAPAPMSPRPRFMAVDTVVLHHTSTTALMPVIRHFSDPRNEVSAHFTIGRDGSVVQHVPAEMAAWHAGPSLDLEGRRRVNQFSIGIELVNTGSQPYPEAQLQSLRRLLKALISHFPIRHIVSHRAIAMPRGRKNDPAGFPWKQVEGLGPKVTP